MYSHSAVSIASETKRKQLFLPTGKSQDDAQEGENNNDAALSHFYAVRMVISA